MITQIKNARLVLPREILAGQNLYFEAGRITAVTPEELPCQQRIDARLLHLKAQMIHNDLFSVFFVKLSYRKSHFSRFLSLCKNAPFAQKRTQSHIICFYFIICRLKNKASQIRFMHFIKEPDSRFLFFRDNLRFPGEDAGNLCKNSNFCIIA